MILAFVLIVACTTVALLFEPVEDSFVSQVYHKEFLFFSPNYLWLLPLIGLVSFGFNWILGFVSARLATRVSSFKSDGQQRLRWMIGLALLMFVIHQAIQFSQMQVFPIVEVATCVLLAVFLYWISETLTGTWNWLKVLLCFLTTVGVLIAVVANNLDWSGLFLVAIPIVVGLLAAGSGVSRNVTVASEQPTTPSTSERAGLPILGTSIGGLFSLMFAVVLLTMPWYLNVPTLFESQPGLGFRDRFEVASLPS